MFMYIHSIQLIACVFYSIVSAYPFTEYIVLCMLRNRTTEHIVLKVRIFETFGANQIEIDWDYACDYNIKNACFPN